jgi:internalin A
MNAEPKAYFNNIQDIILRELDKSTLCIFIAVTWFTNNILFKKLIEKQKSGVYIELILSDDEINKLSFINYKEIEESNGRVIFYKGLHNLMHDKFCVIDLRTVISGSYNWTKQAIFNKENIILISDNEEFGKGFIEEFKAIKYLIRCDFDKEYVSSKIPTKISVWWNLLDSKWQYILKDAIAQSNEVIEQIINDIESGYESYPPEPYNLFSIESLKRQKIILDEINEKIENDQVDSLDYDLFNSIEVLNLSGLDGIGFSYIYSCKLQEASVKRYLAKDDSITIPSLSQEYEKFQNSKTLLDLEPLRAFKNLRMLIISDLIIKDFSAITILNKINYLEIKDTKCHKIDFIETLTSLTSIVLTNVELMHFSWIEQCKKLNKIVLVCNNISDIKPLRRLEELKEANFSGNQIENIEDVDIPSSLEKLVLSNNKKLKLNIKNYLPNLKMLYISGCGISDLLFLKYMPNLELLDLGNNPITDFSGLEFSIKLSTLWFSNTGLSNLKQISKLQNIKRLDLANCPIKDFTLLSILINLEYLNISDTSIKDLNPISNLSKLYRLKCTNTPLIDISPLISLTKLHELDLSGTLLDNIETISNLKQLRYLTLSNTKITDYKRTFLGKKKTETNTLIPLSSLVKLLSLNLSKTRISDLTPISGLKIHYLDISDTEVTDLLPLKSMDLYELNIKKLEISEDQIKLLNNVHRIKKL